MELWHLSFKWELHFIWLIKISDFDLVILGFFFVDKQRRNQIWREKLKTIYGYRLFPSSSASISLSSEYE